MKRVAMGLALALAASSAFAGHANTINKTGFVGVNKTQSAQSLGHSKLVFTALGDYAFGNSMFENDPTKRSHVLQNEYTNQRASVAQYNGISAYVGLAIGLLDYFDIGVTLPVYYDKFNGNTACEPSEIDGGKCDGNPLAGTNNAYVGNVTASLKARAPIPADVPYRLRCILQIFFQDLEEYQARSLGS